MAGEDGFPSSKENKFALSLSFVVFNSKETMRPPGNGEDDLYCLPI